MAFLSNKFPEANHVESDAWDTVIIFGDRKTAVVQTMENTYGSIWLVPAPVPLQVIGIVFSSNLRLRCSADVFSIFCKEKSNVSIRNRWFSMGKQLHFVWISRDFPASYMSEWKTHLSPGAHETEMAISPRERACFSISGWWFTNPSEKYEFVNWDDY